MANRKTARSRSKTASTSTTNTDTATVTSPSNSTSTALSFSDVADAGIIRKMHIVLANGKEGELFYKAMSVKESREFRRSALAAKTEDDDNPDATIDSTRDFLSKYLINPDGSQFATVDQLENIAIDDLMLIFNEIAESMSGNRRSKGKDGNSGNASQTTVN